MSSGHTYIIPGITVTAGSDLFDILWDKKLGLISNYIEADFLKLKLLITRLRSSFTEAFASVFLLLRGPKGLSVSFSF